MWESKCDIQIWCPEFKCQHWTVTICSTNLEQHELVQWVVPLHQKYARRQDTTQIFVTIIRVPAYAAALATPCLGYFCRHHIFPVKSRAQNKTCNSKQNNCTFVYAKKVNEVGCGGWRAGIEVARCPFPQPTVTGSGNDVRSGWVSEAMVNAISSLQCSDVVGWTSGQ